MSLLMAQLVPLLVILLIGCFAVLVFIVRHYLNRGLVAAMSRLQAQTDDAERLRQQAAAKLAEAQRAVQEQLAQAKADADAVKANAVRETEQQHQAAVDQARQDAERIIQQAMQARNALVHEVDQFMRARVVQLAGQLLQAALPVEFRQVTHAQWVDQLLKNGLISAERLTAPQDVRAGRVMSAFPLTSAQRDQLRQRVHDALGRAITWDETVDARLIAGLTIDLGHVVLDGSLASKLREASLHVQEAAGE